MLCRAVKERYDAERGQATGIAQATVIDLRYPRQVIEYAYTPESVDTEKEERGWADGGEADTTADVPPPSYEMVEKAEKAGGMY
jgi:hypothetical protein